MSDNYISPEEESAADRALDSIGMTGELPPEDIQEPVDPVLRDAFAEHIEANKDRLMAGMHEWLKKRD